MAMLAALIPAIAKGLAQPGVMAAVSGGLTGGGARRRRGRRRRIISSSELKDLAAIKQVLGKTAAANAMLLIGRR